MKGRPDRVADEGPAPHPPKSESRRVLLVDDEPRLREMLLTSVKEMGFDPTGSASGEAALKLLESTPFAIAVVDLNLPGMGGMELCEKVRRRWPSVELIILTGFGDLEAARRAIRLDAADFLTKPCGMDELEQALGRAARRWHERWAARVGPPSVEEVKEAPPPAPAPPANLSPAAPPVLSLEAMECQLIVAALDRHQGNREAAAAELGISLRKLYYRLQQYQRTGFPSPPPPAAGR